ncbi:hypothetical protein NC652_013054 [Populus alba x Populus x berolinensis]|nr:hypothetical protein NC652_013054 [Populus alba x Populus x berolinensis]
MFLVSPVVVASLVWVCCDFVWMQLDNGVFECRESFGCFVWFSCVWLPSADFLSVIASSFWLFLSIVLFHACTLGVSPRLTKDRDRFPPNNILFMLFGAGLLWMSWTCFNGGDPCVVSTDASLAVLNTVDFECFHYELKQCFSLTIHRKISECLNAYIRMQILLQRL